MGLVESLKDSRRILGCHIVRGPSRQCRIRRLDCAAKERAVDAVFSAVHLLLFAVRCSRFSAKGRSQKTASANIAEATLVYPKPIGFCAGHAKQRFRGDPAAGVAINYLVATRANHTARLLARRAIFFLVAAGFTVINLWFQSHSTDEVIRNATLVQRLLGAGAVVWFYLWKAILPLHLSFVYSQWDINPGNLLWWLPLAAAVAVTTLLVWQRNSRSSKWIRPVLFAWTFFCLALLPVMGFTDVTYMRNSLVADHYQYIAIIGVVALAAAAVYRGSQRRTPAWQCALNIGAGCVVAALLILTRQQAALYANAMTLYTNTAEHNPTSDLIQLNLGVEHYKAGQINDAVQHFQAALQINPSNDSAHMDLGTALISLGRLDDAIQQFQEVLRLKPSSAATAHCSMGIALIKAGRPRKAIEHLQTSLEINPKHLEACNNLAWVLATASDDTVRDPIRAVELAQKAIELDPKHTDFFNTLGVAYYRAGHWQDAIQWLNKSTQANNGGSAFDWFFSGHGPPTIGPAR